LTKDFCYGILIGVVQRWYLLITHSGGGMIKYRMLALFVVLVLLATGVAVGQNAYMKGNNAIHAGIGFGMAGVYGSSTLPPITVGYEYGFEEKISLGGVLGYSGSKETFGGFGEWTYTYIIIGARGGYHFLENNPDLDAYAGLMLGYNIVSSSASTVNTGFGSFSASASGSYMIFGIYGGARYYFNPNLAVYGELGYGLGFFNVGVAYKL